MDRLLKLFSSRNARIICLVIAILNRSLMVYHYSEFPNYDEKAQLATSINLIRGEGLTEKKYYSASPDTAFYDHTQRWPPGYSIVIAPFLLLFNNNEFFATTCLDIITGIALIFLVYFFCRSLSVNAALTNIAILVCGCFQYYIFFLSYPCDHICLALLLWGLIESIEIIKKSERLSLLKIIGVSLLFAAPSFFRYMYAPISVLLPVMLIVYSFINKKIRLRINGLYLLGGSLLLIAILFAWTKSYSGEFSYVVETEKGIFPEQLVHWYPFMPSAFINIESVQSYISRIVGISYTSVLYLLEIINFFIVVVFFYFLFSFLSTGWQKKYPDGFQFFVLSGTVLSIAIIGVLGYLTLTNKPQVYWNYSIEGRYFIFLILFIQLLMIVRSSFDLSESRNSLLKYSRQFLIVLLLLESVHGVVSTAKNMTTNENPFATKHYMSYRSMIEILGEIEKKYTDRDILVVSPNEYFLYAANNIGFKPIYDYDNVNSASPAVSKRSVLITILNDIDTSYMSKYILERKPVKLAYESFVSFFAEEIDPLPAQ